MIIAIDGPAASGKGTIARRIAAHYRLPHLDTGLLYRATAAALIAEDRDLHDEAEAVALANATDYGLAAYIWTSDLARAHRVAHAVEAGMTWVNSHNVRDLRTPFGGVKASGLGREGGPHSLDFYTESRIVHIPLGDTHVPRFGA